MGRVRKGERRRHQGGAVRGEEGRMVCALNGYFIISNRVNFFNVVSYPSDIIVFLSINTLSSLFFFSPLNICLFFCSCLRQLFFPLY